MLSIEDIKTETKEKLGKTSGKIIRDIGHVVPVIQRQRYAIIRIKEAYDDEEYSSRVDVSTRLMHICENLDEAKMLVKKYERSYKFMKENGGTSIEVSYFIMKPGDELEASYGHAE